MLERAIQELATALENTDEWLQTLEEKLLDTSDLGMLDLLLAEARTRNATAAVTTLENLRGRRLHRAVYSAFYDELPADVSNNLMNIYARREDAAKSRLRALRELETDFGLPSGSLTMYCPDKGMNAKIAAVKIHINGAIEMFDKWERENDNMLSGGHLAAQQHRFRRLWRVHFFLERSTFEKLGASKLDLLRHGIEQLALGRVPHGGSLEESAAALAQLVVASNSAAAGRPQRIIGARGDASTATPGYPTGAPSLRSFRT